MKVLQSIYYLVGTASRIQSMSNQTLNNQAKLSKAQRKIQRDQLVAYCWRVLEEDKEHEHTPEQRESWNALSKKDQLKEAAALADEVEALRFLQENMPLETQPHEEQIPHALSPGWSLAVGIVAVIVAVLMFIMIVIEISN
jgi:hypothetical protein